jgi:hypothetical protein
MGILPRTNVTFEIIGRTPNMVRVIRMPRNIKARRGYRREAAISDSFLILEVFRTIQEHLEIDTGFDVSNAVWSGRVIED